MSASADGSRAGVERGVRRRAPGLATLCLLALALVLGGAAAAVALHDHLVRRAEMRPSLAVDRARHLLLDPRSGADVAFLAARELDPAPRIEVLEGGRYRVAFDVRLASDEEPGPAAVSIRCTVRCDEVDDWTLERLEVGDLPAHECEVRASRSLRASALWSRRIRGWLGA